MRCWCSSVSAGDAGRQRTLLLRLLSVVGIADAAVLKLWRLLPVPNTTDCVSCADDSVDFACGKHAEQAREMPAVRRPLTRAPRTRASMLSRRQHPALVEDQETRAVLVAR